MKKLILGLLMLATSAFAGTSTSRLGLYKPDLQETGWGNTVNNNFNIIDSSVAVLNSTQTFTGEVTIGSGTIGTLRANQVIVASPTYTGNSAIYANGSIAGQTIYVGGTGMIGPPFISFSNGGTGTSMQIYHDGSTNGGMGLRAVNGVQALSPVDNSPTQIAAKRIIAGPSYYTFGSYYSAPLDQSENAFEYAVLIGTVTNDANAKLVVVSSSAYAYDMVVGSAPTSTGKYHLAVSTNGNVYIPTLASGECMQVGTGGLLTTTGAGCGSGSGGGASTLAVFEDSVKVSSPTSIIKFDGTDFSASLVGGSTAFIVLGDSITVTGITLSSITVRSIYWPDGTIQVSSPPAAGGGSGDITAVNVSGEGLTGGAASGYATITIVSTVAYTTKNQTWTAPQTHTSSVTMINNGIAPLTIRDLSVSPPNPRIQFESSSGFLGDLGYIATNSLCSDLSTVCGTGPQADLGSISIDSNGKVSMGGFSGSTVTIKSNLSVGNFTNTVQAAPLDSVVVKGGVIVGTHTANNSALRVYSQNGDTYALHLSTPGQTALMTVSTQGVVAVPTLASLDCIGTDASGNFGSGSCTGGSGGGGYAVEPATVTFQLSKGMTASTGTFTDLLIGTTIQITSATVKNSLTVPQLIGQGGGTSVLTVPHMLYVVTELGVGEGQTGAHVFHALGQSKMSNTGGTAAQVIPLTISATTSNSNGNIARGLDITASGANVTQGILVSASGGVLVNDAIAVTSGRVIFASNTVMSNATFYHNAPAALSSATFRLLTTHLSSMTLSGGYLVQNIPPSSGQVLKFDGTNWAPGTDTSGGGGGTTIWVQQDDSDVDVSVSTIDVRSPLSATSNPSGEVNLDVDRSSFTLVGPKVDLDTLEVSGRLGESNIVSTAAFTTKVQNWTVEQTFSSGSVAGPWSVDGNLHVGGRAFGDAANYLSSNGQAILNKSQSTNDVTVRTANNADAWSARGLTNRIDQSVPQFMLAGSSVSYFDDSSNQYVMMRSSFVNVHSQRYLLTDSTGPVGSPLKIGNIDSNGFVSLVWGTDNSGSGGGASTLAIATGTVGGFTTPGSSPTMVVNLNSTQFRMTPTAGATAYVEVNPSTFTLLGQDPAVAGDVTGTLAAIAVTDDSHAHTGTTLSGIDISDDTNLAASQPLVLTGDTVFLSTNVYVSKMGVSWDGGGSVLTTGTTYWFPIPSSGTITGFTLTGLPSGSVSINVSSSSIFNTGAVGICASACPTLSPGTSQRDTTLTGWSKTLAKDGFLYFVINSASTATQAVLSLEWVKL